MEVMIYETISDYEPEKTAGELTDDLGCNYKQNPIILSYAHGPWCYINWYIKPQT